MGWQSKAVASSIKDFLREKDKRKIPNCCVGVFLLVIYSGAIVRYCCATTYSNLMCPV